MKRINSDVPFKQAIEMNRNKVMYYPSQCAVGTELHQWHINSGIMRKAHLISETKGMLYICLN